MKFRLIEEKENKKCTICGEEIKGYGNNAAPVKDGICCDKCNKEVVIPARLKGMKKSLDLDEALGLKESGEKEARFIPVDRRAVDGRRWYVVYDKQEDEYAKFPAYFGRYTTRKNCQYAIDRFIEKNPDYKYIEESLEEALYGKDEISDFFDKAKRLGVTKVSELKDLLNQEESKGNTEKEKIDAYADSVELGNDTLSNESLKEDLSDKELFKKYGATEEDSGRGWSDEDHDHEDGLIFSYSNEEDAKIAADKLKQDGFKIFSIDKDYTCQDGGHDIWDIYCLDEKTKNEDIKELPNVIFTVTSTDKSINDIQKHIGDYAKVSGKGNYIYVTTDKEHKDLVKGDLEDLEVDYVDFMKIDECNSLKEDLNKESLEEEIRKAVREHFRTWDDADYEDMIGDYLVVEVEDQEDGRTKVEVRAELSYATLDNIADELNKIVQKYDKDAYFDHEDSGIINAFIDKNAGGKTIDEFKPYSDEKLNGIRIPGYTNKWSAIDHMEVNGTDYYMFENDTYGDETWYLVTSNINDGPFYETYDDIETCLRDEGIIGEDLNEVIDPLTAISAVSTVAGLVDQFTNKDENLEEEKNLDEVFVDTYLTKEHLGYVLHNVLDWERGYSPKNKSDIWEVAHACHIYDDTYSDSEYAEAIELYDAFDEEGNVTSRIDEKLIQNNLKEDFYLDPVEDLATKISKYLKLNNKEKDMLIHDINNLRGNEWLEDIKSLNKPDLTKKFIEIAQIHEDDLDEKLIQGKSDATLKKNIATEIEAGKDPKQAYAIAKSVQKKNESFEEEHLGEVAKDDEIVDYFDNSVHPEDIVEDDFDEEHIEELAKKAVEESKKHTKEVGTAINENKTEATPTQEIINESLESNEEVALDYVSPNAVDANFQAQEVDLNNI